MKTIIDLRNDLDNNVVTSEELFNEANFKVNPLKVIANSELVTEVESFVPNYLRIVEAEYNLEHKND